MRRSIIALILTVLATPAYAQQWDQVNGSMQVKSGPTAPLVIIDQTRSGQKILSLRSNGTEKCYVDVSGNLNCVGTYTLNGAITVSIPSLGTTSTDGVVLTNPTAAAAGAQQVSPALVLSSYGWKTDATAGSQLTAFRFYNLPIQGAANPTHQLLLQSQIDGGAWTTRTTFDNGAIGMGGTLDMNSSAISEASVIEINAGSYLRVSGAFELMDGGATGRAIFRNAAQNAGVGLDFATDSVLLFKNRAHNAAGGIGFASLAVSGTAPSAPVACTTPTVTWSNGTATFQIDVGGTCAGISTLAVTMPAASNAWMCDAMNVTTSATGRVEMTASTTTSATFTSYTRTTGLALVWVDGTDVRIKCSGG